jgi:pyruvate dehydrogenase E2 component (dihydrolipoamide acetyltransferase)
MDGKIVPLTVMRKKIAETVTNSKQNIPHFYAQVDVDMGEILKIRQNWSADKGKKPTVNHCILKAAVTALIQVPAFNSSYSQDGIRQYESINIGFAMSLDGGMIIPVIKEAERMNFNELSEAARELAQKAKNRRLLPQDYTGATFTVSNMGMFGIKTFAAIISPPQAAILAVGAIEAVPRWDGTSVVPKQSASMVLSIDHRIADGALAASFLSILKESLENPRDLFD